MTLERLKDASDVFLQVSDFPSHGPDRLGLVRRQMGEILGSLGMLHLCFYVRTDVLSGVSVTNTSLLPSSPYICSTSEYPAETTL